MRKHDAFKSVAIGLALLVIGQTGQAATTASFKVAVDTTPLVGHPAGPFSILFSLTDGSGLADGNNTVNIGAIDLAGGSGQGNATLFGGTSGSIESGITLTDTSPLNVFSESFSPGSVLRFTLSVTTADDDGGIPDRLCFYILDSSGVPIPTLSPGADFLFGVDLGSTVPSPEAFGTDPSRSPTSGSPIVINPPKVRLDIDDHDRDRDHERDRDKDRRRERDNEDHGRPEARAYLGRRVLCGARYNVVPLSPYRWIKSPSNGIFRTGAAFENRVKISPNSLESILGGGIPSTNFGRTRRLSRARITKA
jgi:hypothetical protein